MFKPQDLKFTKEHEWISTDGTVGISDHAQKELGDVVFVELPKLSAVLKKGQEMGVLESVKSVSSMYSPVDGTVSKVNEKLSQAPELVNHEPYGQGWIARLSISDVKQLDGLMNYSDYMTFIGK
ncbi:MAG: glycine cleavage system protein GcvH [Candidatus Margulisiibacteriota bacterium]